MVRISKYLAILAIGLFVSCSEQEEPCRECYDVLNYKMGRDLDGNLTEYTYNVIDNCDNERYAFLVAIDSDLEPPRDVICDRTFFEVYGR